jgi:hypothetical protein
MTYDSQYWICVSSVPAWDQTQLYPISQELLGGGGYLPLPTPKSKFIEFPWLITRPAASWDYNTKKKWWVLCWWLRKSAGGEHSCPFRLEHLQKQTPHKKRTQINTSIRNRWDRFWICAEMNERERTHLTLICLLLVSTLFNKASTNGHGEIIGVWKYKHIFICQLK